MNIAIRYYTRSGNTERLAHAIAEALGTEAYDIGTPLEEKAEILFLGCSYYAFDIDTAVKDFITENKDRIGKIVCFGTSAMMRSMKKPVSRIAKALSVEVSEEEFHCRGQFGNIHKGRPDETDLKAVAEFAKKIAIP